MYRFDKPLSISFISRPWHCCHEYVSCLGTT